MAEEKKVNETVERKTALESLGMQTIMQARGFSGVTGMPAPEHYPILVGLQASKKKDGTGYAYNLYLEEDYNEYDLLRGQCIGVKTSSVYVRDESKIPPDLKIGDHIKIYSVQRGQYVVVDEIRIMN